MAIDERPDGQMLMTIAFVGGCLITGVIALILICWMWAESSKHFTAEHQDCSQQVQELQNAIRHKDNEIKRLEVFEQALKWGKKK